MRLILHIGTPKTATTYLQDTLSMNSKWLASLGLSYPDMLTGHVNNHMTLFYAAAQYIHAFARGYGIHTDADRIAFRHKLKAHIRSLVDYAPEGIDTLIFSSENLSANMDRPGVFSLYEMLAPIFDEITVVSYIRRQDDGLLSMYAEHMRQGFSHGDFSEFITKTQTGPNPSKWANYNRLLGNWADAFGKSNIVVRRFENEHFKGNLGILSDFISLIKGRDTEIPNTVYKVKNSNISLSAPVLKYLSLLNVDFPFAHDDIPCEKRQLIQKVFDDLPASAKPTMTHEQSDRIMSFYAVSNEALRKTWFPNETTLFGPSKSVADFSNLDILSLEDSVAFSAQILKAVIR